MYPVRISSLLLLGASRRASDHLTVAQPSAPIVREMRVDHRAYRGDIADGTHHDPLRQSRRTSHALFQVWRRPTSPPRDIPRQRSDNPRTPTRIPSTWPAVTST